MLRLVKKASVFKKRVLLRVDFNIPLSDSGELADTFRIKAVLPTLLFLKSHKAKIIIATHLGEPDKPASSLSTKHLVGVIREVCGLKVKWFGGFNFDSLSKSVNKLEPGEIALLENLRFNSGEISNSKKFAKGLASLADVYVNDAFGTMHRYHASIVGVPLFLPSYCGFLVKKELGALEKIVYNPARPFTVIMAGGKLSTKARLLKPLFGKANSLVVGGILGNNFLKVHGFKVGRSIIEPSVIRWMKKVKFPAKKIFLPKDFIVARAIRANVKTRIVSLGEPILAKEYILDIGPKTIDYFASVIKFSKTILWNGPVGYYELRPFRRGTIELARRVAKAKAHSVIGGGDIIGALNELDLLKKMSHISSGGGAMLEFVAYKNLPGLKILGY
ncbi:phosphoglycerate kinase [Candidatus Parcubacteria bacterium]|nr:MAG: phosphoglycerate kinase [Candidatus Parcubacteria bacterium]